MSQALKAHMRLSSMLPKRTHEAKSWMSKKGAKTNISDGLVSSYLELKTAGMKYDDIKRKLHVCTLTMAKIAKMAQK